MLATRRDVTVALFIYKLLHNYIDAPNLLQQVKFRVPLSHLRHKPFGPFQLSLVSTPLMLTLANFNRLVLLKDVDIFHDSIKVIVKKFHQS